MPDELQELVSLCPDPIIGIDVAGVVNLFNDAAQRLLGYTREEALHRLHITRIYPTADAARTVGKLLHTSPERQIEGYETQVAAKDGRVVDIRLSARMLLREGALAGSIGFFHDLTERKQLESKLKLMSITDSLTGLFNQRHFMEILASELDRAKRYRRPLSIICIDLDNFKQVNDSLGHLEGDQALRTTARLIQESLRKTDMAFRCGGDEFVVLLPEAVTAEAERIGARLKSTFDQKWAADWLRKPACPQGVTLSLGVAEFDQHESADSLVRRADNAMYEAKRKAHGALA